MRPPQQTRSRRTLDRIATAALELMEEVGPEGATVAAIVERAGTSVGSFYARFPGKEELIRYLQERVWSEARKRWDEALGREDWDTLPLEAIVQRVVGLLILSYRGDFMRQRALGQAQIREGGSAILSVRFHTHLLESLLPILLARREEITHPNPVRGVTLGYQMVVGAIREVMELDEAGAEGLEGDTTTAADRGDLGTELSRAWTAYLTWGRVPERTPEPGVADFFDPWGE